MREADAAGGGPVENGRRDGARLRDERDTARCRRKMSEARVEAMRRNRDAERVRPYDAQQPLPVRVERHAQRAPRVGSRTQPGGDDDRAAHAARSELADDGRHRGRRRRDDGQVGTRGRSATLAYARRSSTRSCRALTANTSPGNAARFSSRMRPIEPERSLAPITATERRAKHRVEITSGHRGRRPAARATPSRAR